MSRPEYTNCYCFNPECSISIFNNQTFSGIKTPLIKVLKQEVLCLACGEECISTPLLEIKLSIYDSLHTTTIELTA